MRGLALGVRSADVSDPKAHLRLLGGMKKGVFVYTYIINNMHCMCGLLSVMVFECFEFGITGNLKFGVTCEMQKIEEVGPLHASVAVYHPRSHATISRDPYIIHLNIALSRVVTLYFDGKSHVSTGQNVSFKEP